MADFIKTHTMIALDKVGYIKNHRRSLRHELKKCTPRAVPAQLMDVWNRFSGRKYHVLGNHDIELGCTKEQAVEFWKSEGKYYSLDQNGYHLVVLDGNDRNPEHKTPWQYERYISAEQIQWLEDDLDKTHLPTIVFCHQGLDTEGGIENAVRIRISF